MIFLSLSQPVAAEKLDALKKSLCESLGCEAEDLVVLPSGVSIQFTEGASKAPKKKPEETEEAGSKPDLHSKTVAELREHAHKKNINLHGASTKEEIIEAIENPH